MKKVVLLALLTVLTTIGVWADSQADFSKSIASYNTQIKAGNYGAAARSVAAAAEACAAVKNYDGAFKVLTGAERTLAAKEITPETDPAVYYTIAQAKFDIYSKFNNKASAQKQLQQMVNLAGKSGSKDLMESMLTSAAKYYYSVGETAKGDQCLSRLVAQYNTGGDLKSTEAAYKKLIGKAVAANDARMVEQTYSAYMNWTDSVEAANADSELNKVKKDYADSQATIAMKDKTIAGKSGLIATFVVLFVAALATIGFCIWLYLRIMAKNRRMHKSVEAANEQSAAKSAILHNMAGTMEPTLEQLDQDNPAVKSLRGYVKRVGELSDVGDSTPKAPEELEDVNIEKFCNDVADAARAKVKEGVKMQVDAARGTARIDAEEVSKILAHLLDNAAKYTPAGGRITLSYKKRGAKVHQFIVSDTGAGVPKDKRETLFTAFSGGADLAEGDGLGLPICALRAEKLNGTLELDTDHSQGATFVLTVRA